MDNREKSILPEVGVKQAYVREMFDRIAPRYELVNRLMTGGLDVLWRRRLIDLVGVSSGQRVLDLACGTGDFVRILAQVGATPVGLDLSRGMLSRIRTHGDLVQAVGEQLPFAEASFSAVVSGFAVRNFVDFPAVLSECQRVLRPMGQLGILEVATPRYEVVRRVHHWYFGSVVPRLGSLLSDATAYRYLPESVSYLPSDPEFVELFHAAGFVRLRRVEVGFGAAQLWVASRA
jgi:demethylmenaquinone methyltransferase/2-methoxy-6-polyprenyl-1,4-benzoquinol methylase